MREAGVSSFKTYFAYDHLRLDDAETLEVLEELKRVGGILCVHCENGTLVNELQKRVFEQGIHGPEGHALSRPDVCEAEAVSRLLYLAHLAATHGQRGAPFDQAGARDHPCRQGARAEEYLCRDLPSVSDARRYVLLGAGRGRLCGRQVCDEPAAAPCG